MSRQKVSTDELISIIIKGIDDDKGENIQLLDSKHFERFHETSVVFFFLTYPVGKNCQDELPRHKSFQNSLDNSEVGSQGNVTFKTHIRELWLRSDVDSHIFSLKSTKS